eukprot:2990273-Pyramimonas_sp.AAC.2
MSWLLSPAAGPAQEPGLGDRSRASGGSACSSGGGAAASAGACGACPWLSGSFQGLANLGLPGVRKWAGLFWPYFFLQH